MARITIDFPDSTASRLITKSAIGLGYQATIIDPDNPGGPRIPNPISEQDFLKSKILDFLKTNAVQQETKEGQEGARQRAESEIIVRDNPVMAPEVIEG